ncbi:unnamed protein product [Caenorhabditis angaria]|uniref:Uncharacterized protein n=1 Tax=Caenorhabditis angaria TaxID=860376 RepID=A0A9P1IXZ5_9PELO|nr:unnamed protein product [Caenorhabditis angaria]
MKRSKAAHKSMEPALQAKYLFHHDRALTFKKFPFDSMKTATCTSAALAAAGFYCTATKEAPTSAKCPFCLKELEFDPEDDPWEEHLKRGQNCEFVKLNKLDDKSWTVEETIRLGNVCRIQQNFENQIAFLDGLKVSTTTNVAKLKLK